MGKVTFNTLENIRRRQGKDAQLYKPLFFCQFLHHSLKHHTLCSLYYLKMHLKNLLSYGLLAGFSFTTTFAANPAADALTTISTKLDSLVKNLNAWNGDIVTVADIMLQSEELLDVIDKA